MTLLFTHCKICSWVILCRKTRSLFTLCAANRVTLFLCAPVRLQTKRKEWKRAFKRKRDLERRIEQRLAHIMMVRINPPHQSHAFTRELRGQVIHRQWRIPEGTSQRKKKQPTIKYMAPVKRRNRPCLKLGQHRCRPSLAQCDTSVYECSSETSTFLST